MTHKYGQIVNKRGIEFEQTQQIHKLIEKHFVGTHSVRPYNLYNEKISSFNTLQFFIYTVWLIVRKDVVVVKKVYVRNVC